MKGLWTCPACGRTFANTNQTHTCAPLGYLHARFTGSAPAAHLTSHRVVAYSPHNVLHALRLHTPADLDPALSALLSEAYSVGRQDHRR